MGNNPRLERRFFHSFPRPKRGEDREATLDRGLEILALMKSAGLILAPEVVEWDASVVAGRAEQFRILQRRACFTELSPEELPSHAAVFGPVALSFDVAKLRSAGATPVIYAPQGLAESALSQLSTFCVRGAHHTRHVLQQLQGLKEMSDPAIVGERYQIQSIPTTQSTFKILGRMGKWWLCMKCRRCTSGRSCNM